jgi:transposase
MPPASWTRSSIVCKQNALTLENSTRSCGALMAPSSALIGVPAEVEKRGSEETEDHALGRSRGGFTTKIHLLCDGYGHPLHFHLTAGQTHDSTVLDTVLEGADVRLRDSAGEPVAWPVALGGDKGYRADWIDEYLLELGIRPVIPSKENEDRADRPVKFDRQQYRRRNIVERLIGWLKEARRVFSRYEKTAVNFGGFVKMAFIERYLRLATRTRKKRLSNRA